MADGFENDAVETVKRPRRRRGAWLLTGGALLVSGGALWLLRAPLADNLVADELRDRDVAAAYRIDAIGPRTQRLVDVVIGDPQRPDLVARTVEIDVRWTWRGPEVAAIRADGVRLHGRWADGRIRLGEVDKLLPPPGRESFVFPDLALTLTDARALIATPWGDFGINGDGNGELREDFRGTIAVVTERVDAAGCRTGRATAYGTLRLNAAKPRFTGPVRAVGIGCNAAKIGLARLDASVDATLTADFASWQGRVDGTASDLRATGVQLANLLVVSSFSGSAMRTKLRFAATGKQLQAADMLAREITGEGTAVLGTAAPTVAAKVRLAGASLPERLQRSVAALGDGAGPNPLAPIMSRLGMALGRAGIDFGGAAEIALTGSTRTRRLEIIAPNIRSASGAMLRADPTSRIAILLGGRQTMALVDGRWSLSGGGLPMARLEINRNAGGAVRGTLALEPLAAGTTRVALAPVTIRGDRSGALQLATRATVAGPLGGGRVDGLSMAINAVVAPSGAIRLATGCQFVNLDRAVLAGFRLGPNRVQLCSAAGQPLLTYDRRGLTGELLFPGPQLVGTSGVNPLAARAVQARYALATGRWMASGLEFALGSGDAATRFTARSVDGAAGAAGPRGRFEGGAGAIGAVPLNMTDIAGDWRWTDAKLTLTGGLTVSDKLAEPRFNPLVSTNAVLGFVDGKVDASASFSERETNTAIGRTDVRHDFSSARGSADLIIMAMRFNAGFQPDQLTPLALGVIANARGTLAGRGRIDWTGANIRSSGTFTTAGSDFAAAFGSVSGASTTMVFDDLLAVHTLPGQRISFDEINPGFPVIGGMIDYQLLDATNIRIEGGSWPFAGGDLILRPSTLDFAENAVRRLEFELKGVDAAIFLTELGFANISASGVFDGVLPVEFSGLGGRIVGGRLVARSGGGHVAYVGELTNYNLGTMANFAFNILKSLKYQAMEIALNGDLDGEMLTDVKITGLSQGEGASRNIITRQIEKLPIEFNVRINAPFRQLISSAKSLYDPSVLIDQNLFLLIAAQRAKENAPVQPRESETVP